MARDAILALNAGSSSVKFALFGQSTGDRPELTSHGVVEGIGGSPHFLARDPHGASLAERRFPKDTQYEALLDALLGFVADHLGGDRLGAVGHRVVHGGTAFDRPVRVTDTVLATLDALPRSRRCTSRTTWRRSARSPPAGRTCRRLPVSTPPSIMACRCSPPASPCRAS